MFVYINKSIYINKSSNQSEKYLSNQNLPLSRANSIK